MLRLASRARLFPYTTLFRSTGQSATDFWNLYSRDDGSGGYRTFGEVSNLKRADGTVSAVGLTVANAPGAWHNGAADPMRAEEHTSVLQSHSELVWRLLPAKK